MLETELNSVVEHILRLSRGDFDVGVEVPGNPDLAAALNELTAQLRTRFELYDVTQNVAAQNAAQLAKLVDNLARANAEMDLGRRKLAASEARISAIMDTAAEGIITITEDGFIEDCNAVAGAVFGYAGGGLKGVSVKTVIPEFSLTPDMSGYGRITVAGALELEGRRMDGTSFPIELSVDGVVLDGEKLFTAMVRDATQRKRAEAERRSLETELARARKLESVGQLAAGIAHEINTPTQYVGDNLRFLQESFAELAPRLKKADELAEAVRKGTGASELADELKAALEQAEVEYLTEEIPRAIGQSLHGIDRVRKIVQSMKDFSHPGVEGMTQLDLNHAIESTITVASNEWKYVAEMATDFDPELPPVPCLPGELNQVVLNMIVNAAHAIADVVGDGEEGKGTITISTRRDGEFVEIRIADTGSGIPEKARDKIFDPFFTTKTVGKGTGQGLSIAHGVVVQKHGGALVFETEIGKGTTFIIRLPLERQGVEEPV